MRYKIFTDFQHYDKGFRGYLADILRPYVKDYVCSPDVLLKQYGEWVSLYELTDDIASCDFVVLPMTWGYYHLRSRLYEADRLLFLARSHNKRVLSFDSGDFNVPPTDRDVYIFRQNGYGCRRLKHQFAYPAFFSDPLPKFFNREVIIERNKGVRPVVGFCGQAKASFSKVVKDVCRSCFKNALFALHLSVFEPHCVYSSTLRRERCLAIIEGDGRLDSNFIKRDKYRAGVKTEEERFKTSLEFYNNIADSDYTVCLRGGGNFSVRLYETLAMGRIPVYIHTDDILPFDSIIDWKRYVVWVDEKDISFLPERILDFHSGLSNGDFKELQIACRNLFRDYLSMDGFMRHLPSLLDLGY